MKIIRKKATIKGVEVEMLFTPRLFDLKSATMDFTTSTESVGKVVGMYADIMYLAALNIWTLNDKDIADFPLTRVDFHEWAVLEPSDFGKTMKIALEAITNKSLEELLKENDKGSEKAKKSQTEIKKKTSKSLIQRLRLFWSAIVG